MGAQVRIERGAAGGLLAVKAARPGAEESLREEAALLSTLCMPGVVELVGESVPIGDGGQTEAATLVTRWVGPRTAADLDRPVSPERAAGLCVAVAATVARLHRAGVVHGAIEASHVVLDAAGRPVLCGFGSAGAIGGTRRPADDVAGLGRLLNDLLTAPERPGDDSVAVRRSDRSRHRALLAVAAQAAVEDPGSRPSVTAFVHGVRRAVPEARLDPDTPARPSRQAPTDRKRSDRTRRPRRRTTDVRAATTDDRARPSPDPGARAPASRARAALGVAAVVVAGATAYFGLTAWGSPTITPTASQGGGPAATSTAPDPRPTTAVSSPTSTRSTTAVSTTSVSPTTIASAAPASPGAPVVEHLGHRYEVGEPGDVAAVGPWLCDGNDVVALLRPSTGTVHVFADWASPQSTVEARAVASVPGASSLRAVADGPGCAVLVVGAGEGPLRTLTADELR